MKKLFREPLVHFAAIGAALFVLYGSVNNSGLASTDNRIVVSAGRIDQLVSIFQKTWQRPPTAEELKGLIDDFVLEEVYYRQAVAMGIDRNDAVIRRRLRQKFEFLTDDMAAAISPTDKDLTAYIATNQQQFKKDTTYTFSQVYINPGEADADKLITDTLERLRNGDMGPQGSGLLPAYFESTSARVVNGSFGAGFSEILDGLETGQWTGPVESGLGMHLILLQDRVPGFVPELADIRPIVEREWANEKRIGTRQTINETLLANYNVVIEWPTE